MKTIIASLVVLLFAFLIGCQNSITDPVVPDQTNFSNAVEETVAYKDVITSTWPGLIRLHNSIYDPSHPNLSVLLTGNIKYKVEPAAAVESIGYTNMKVNFYVDVELKSGCPRQQCSPSVRNFAEANIKISTAENDVYFIEKSFIVRNACCGQLTLGLKFGVRGNDVFLVSSTLKPRGGWVPINYDF
jgi:hypothetical protein